MATTSFKAVQSDVSLKVKNQPPIDISQGNNISYKTTSFGQFIFKAEKNEMEPMYGLIPLKFNGGYLAVDILFFAPGAFFNLREVYPYYQFDLEKNEIHYKKKESDEWNVYKPTPEEMERAKKYFEGQI